MLHRFVSKPIYHPSLRPWEKCYALDSCGSIPRSTFGNLECNAGIFEGGQDVICPDMLFSQF